MNLGHPVTRTADWAASRESIWRAWEANDARVPGCMELSSSMGALFSAFCFLDPPEVCRTQGLVGVLSVALTSHGHTYGFWGQEV